MNAIPSTLYTAAFTLCLFSAGILRDRQTRVGSSYAFFTAFLLLESLGFVLELLMAHQATPLKGLWLGLRMGSSLLLAPCLWLALREIVEGERPRISTLPRGHLIAVAVGAMLTLPLIETAHFGTDYADPNHSVSALHSRVIHTTMFLCMVIFAVQIPFYLVRCRRLLREADREEHGSTGGSRAQRAWLHLPLIALAGTWVVGLARTLHCAILHGAAGYAPWFAFAEVSVTTCAVYLVANRASLIAMGSNLRPADIKAVTRAEGAVAEIESSAPQETTEAAAFAETEPAAQAPLHVKPRRARYAKSVLDEDLRKRIRDKLESAMAREQLFKDSLLSLESLSRAIRENKHHVSQVLNQDVGMSFFEFVAHHRIDAAKRMIRRRPDQTILEIALDVGFNAKSTFNTAFRRVTGTTPKGFRTAVR